MHHFQQEKDSQGILDKVILIKEVLIELTVSGKELYSTTAEALCVLGNKIVVIHL